MSSLANGLLVTRKTKAAFLVIIFAVIPHYYVFSQEGPENLLAINLSYLIPNPDYDLDIGLGFWYERYMTDSFTVGADFGVKYTKYNADMSSVLINFAPNWRLYPLATATSGLFAYIETGWTLILYTLFDADVTANQINLQPGIGYKFIIGERFLLEPCVGYNFNFIFIEDNQYLNNDYKQLSVDNIVWSIVFGFGIF